MAAFLLGILFYFGLRYWQKKQVGDPLIKRLKSGNMEVIGQAAIVMNQVRDVRRLQRIAENIRIIYQVHEKTEWNETRNHLWTIIQRLQHLIYRQGCLCKVYPLDNYSDPEVEDKKAEVRILNVVNYCEDKKYRLCRCRSCEEKFIVIDGFWGKWVWETRWCWKSLTQEQYELMLGFELNSDDIMDLYGKNKVEDLIARHQIIK